MVTMNVDLGSAQEVEALVIYDHNLSATATITLKGVDPTIFSEAVTWNDDKIIHYLSTATTKRYWQLQITDDSNTDGYVQIGEIYLGSYLQLTQGYTLGFSRDIDLLRIYNGTPYGIEKDRFYNQQKHFYFDFNNIPSADITSLESMIDTIVSRSTGTLKPFWFNTDQALPNNSWLVKITYLPVRHVMKDYYTAPLEFIEVVTSV